MNNTNRLFDGRIYNITLLYTNAHTIAVLRVELKTVSKNDLKFEYII